MGGQTRIRVGYGKETTAWFDYLMVSRPELVALLDGTGWRLARTIDADHLYVAVLEKI
jgi:hypothetical protein